ncbi:HAD family hydrolase [Anaerosporobacter sp.]|uniref:HAD family hydrolase n=1 Tax=Anaerosporobacter sp. TaxID=1872529 RepID=UPI00286EE902|nr:HAD family phosphatase [Anaerosporobacter sp.]
MTPITDILQSHFKVASFDMDGTLIKGTTSNLFYAKLLNVEDKVIQLENELKAGRIDSNIFMVSVSEIMDKLTVDYIKEHFDLLPIVDGIAETVNTLKEAGIKPIIVTTSNILFAECFKEKYGFDEVFGTVHEVLKDGTVGIGTTVCSSKHKIEHVQSIVESLGGNMEDVFAVGDSFSDVPLFEKVGFSVAFNHDETLEGKADLYVKSNTIYSVMEAIAEYFT